MHTHDNQNHRRTIKTAVTKRVRLLKQVENPKPLTIYVEDPTQIPEIEKLIPKKGVLPGLVQELNALELPKHTIEKTSITENLAAVFSSGSIRLIFPIHSPMHPI